MLLAKLSIIGADAAKIESIKIHMRKSEVKQTEESIEWLKKIVNKEPELFKSD